MSAFAVDRFRCQRRTPGCAPWSCPLIGRRPKRPIGKTRRLRRRATRPRADRHINGFNSMAIAVTGEAATDGSVAPGSTSTSRYRSGAGFSTCRAIILRSGGSERARLSRLNDNGARPAEPFEKGAVVTTGQRLSEKRPTQRGSVLSAACSLHPGGGRGRHKPVRPDAGAAQGDAGGGARARACRLMSKLGWSAAAMSRARSSRAAGSASKASTSSWSMSPARSSDDTKRLRRLLPVRTRSLWRIRSGCRRNLPRLRGWTDIMADRISEKSIVRLGSIPISPRTHRFEAVAQPRNARLARLQAICRYD